MARQGAAERARAIRLLLLDVDGTLTDGRLLLGPQGEEWKAFDSRDGLGIRIARGAGLEVGIVSGRTAPVTRVRARELGLDLVDLGTRDKARSFEAARSARGLEAGQVGFMGDDLTDVPALLRAGLGATVADAAAEVRAVAQLVSGRPGGRGAVREVIEFVLRAQGRWDEVLRAHGLEAGTGGGA